MVTAFDAAVALAGGVNSPQDAWRFITTFAEQWTTALTPDDGFTSQEITEAEDRLGIGLPTVLQEAHKLFGRRADMIAWQDPLLKPADLHLEDTASGRILVFRTENQGCWAWGIAEQDLSCDDPPALLYSDSQKIPSWRPFLDRTSAALVEAVLSEQAILQQCDGRELARHQPASRELLATVEAVYPRVELPASPWSSAPEESVIRWHAGPGCIIQIVDGTNEDREAIVTAQAEEYLQQALAAISGPWIAPSIPKARKPPQLPPGIKDPWAIPGGYFSH